MSSTLKHRAAVALGVLVASVVLMYVAISAFRAPDQIAPGYTPASTTVTLAP